jgi:phosphate butyryltransferase
MKLDHYLKSKLSMSKRHRIAVACAEDEAVLKALSQAAEEGWIEAYLYGDKAQIETILDDLKLSFKLHIFHCENAEEACSAAVQAVHKGEAELLMKGLVDTSVFLKAVLNKEWGIRKASVLSHVTVAYVPKRDRIYLLSDAAMNIAPDLMSKKAIIENSVEVAHALGLTDPKVAVLSAVEKVNPRMPSSVDAAELSAMAKRGEIVGCQVDGPFALDNAVDEEAAHHKGVTHPNAGHADVLIVPNIEAGNMLFKAITFLAFGETAGVVMGAAAPIVLTSRADKFEDKYHSILLAHLLKGQAHG